MSSAAATPISTNAAAPNSSALDPESPPVFGSVLGARVGVAAPVVVPAVAAAVAPVVVAAAVAAVVVAALVAVVCSSGAAAVVAPTNGTSSTLNTMIIATATTTARDVLRIESSLILH